MINEFKQRVHVDLFVKCVVNFVFYFDFFIFIIVEQFQRNLFIDKYAAKRTH